MSLVLLHTHMTPARVLVVALMVFVWLCLFVAIFRDWRWYRRTSRNRRPGYVSTAFYDREKL